MTTPSSCIIAHILRKGRQLAECVTNLSAEENCSSSIMLRKIAEITHDIEVVEA